MSKRTKQLLALLGEAVGAIVGALVLVTIGIVEAIRGSDRPIYFWLFGAALCLLIAAAWVAWRALAMYDVMEQESKRERLTVREDRARRMRENRVRRAAKRQGRLLRKSRTFEGEYVLIDASTVGTVDHGRGGKAVLGPTSLDEIETALSETRTTNPGS